MGGEDDFKQKLLPSTVVSFFFFFFTLKQNKNASHSQAFLVANDIESDLSIHRK